MKDYSLQRAAQRQQQTQQEIEQAAEQAAREEATRPPERPRTAVDEITDLARQLPEGQLAALRHEIDVLLELDIADMDLAKETVLQYRQGKALLAEVQNDRTVPANQQAQLFNTVRAQLTEIFKQQETIWSMERLKKFEVAFVKSCHLLSPEAKEAFMSLYGEYLKELPNG